jgi:hypothetical protein
VTSDLAARSKALPPRLSSPRIVGAFIHPAAQTRAMPRVGILTPAPSAAAKPLWDAFREAMKELGHVEGKSVVYEYRSAEGHIDRLPQLAAELVKIPVKVLVVATTPGTLAAKKVTTTIPIVMVAVGDPVRVGIVSNLGTGRKRHGFTTLTGQLTAKRLQPSGAGPDRHAHRADREPRHSQRADPDPGCRGRRAGAARSAPCLPHPGSGAARAHLRGGAELAGPGPPASGRPAPGFPSGPDDRAGRQEPDTRHVYIPGKR